MKPPLQPSSDFRQEEALGNIYDARLFTRLLTYVRPYRRLITCAVILMLLAAATDIARPYLIKVAIDNYIARSDLSGLFGLIQIYLLVIIAGFIFNYLHTYVLHYTGQRIIFDLRQAVFTHLLRMSVTFFDKNPVGRLITRVTNDTEAIREMYTDVLVNLCKDAFLVLGIMLVMLHLNVRLALVSFFIVPVIIGVTVIYRRRAREMFREVRTRLAQINAALQEYIAGMRVIQAFNREERIFEKFKTINRDYYAATLQELASFAVFRPSMDFLYSLTVALLIWYGGGQVLEQAVSFGVLYAFTNYTEQFFRPITDLADKYTVMQSAMAAAERVFLLLDETPGVSDPSNPVALPSVRGEIAFNNVWFAYNAGEWVLKDVSFSIRPGETVAFVGATGAGKTTLINLITRFYDVTRGSITLDGVDIRNLRQADLRSYIGVVFQDAFLFTRTVAGNIRLNETRISDAEVAAAARYVNADPFIARLPGGYKAQIQERGATFSTGQRQLLAFARTLAFNPPLLVLDEATANIDTETEALIQDALNKLTRGRTTIIIAHRLSTIHHADKIIVMHKGQVVETGNHETLIAKRGFYYRLYQLQSCQNGTA